MKTQICGVAAALFFASRAWGQAGQPADVTNEIAELRAAVVKLQSRIDQLEARLTASSATPAGALVSAAAPSQDAAPAPSTAHSPTVNLLLDGYYGYNFNRPIGRVNLLRAFDVSSNAFSLNQAAVVVEQAPDPANGRRWGARLDLQFGEATQSMQGNPANEPRPEIYRSIFQAYGTYVAPLAKGLTIDFGKWACFMGVEGNYTKDQINYSRSYLFDFLPFYHMGVRTSLKLTDTLTAYYWLTNGTNQTEPFKGSKDQLFGFSLQPRKDLSWSANYYFGDEHPDVVYFPNGATGNLPVQQGVPFQPITLVSHGKLHILDTYGTWQASAKLTFAAEADWVISRLYSNSAPAHSAGGAAYARYQFSPHVAIGARGEYLSDRGALFSGTSQALKETTLTLDYKFADGFLMRGEFRRDFSNQPYFLTDQLGVLKKEQNTATLGLIWWTGQKQGAW